MNDPTFITRLCEAVEGKDSAQRFCANEGGAYLVLKRAAALLATKKKPPRERKPALEIDGFAEWYAAYPRHVARKAAARAYTTARRMVDREVLLAGAKRYAGQVAGSDPKFIRHPATWLAGGCWADEYPAPVDATGTPRKWEADEVWEARLRYHAGLEGFPLGFWKPLEWGGAYPGATPPAVLARFKIRA